MSRRRRTPNLPGTAEASAPGLAGGRDFANRPVMGALAARNADFFTITQDDPGDEDTAAIAAQIARGARSVGARAGSQFTIELDRRAAIRRPRAYSR